VILTGIQKITPFHPSGHIREAILAGCGPLAVPAARAQKPLCRRETGRFPGDAPLKAA